jgi:hypothetical protein
VRDKTEMNRKEMTGGYEKGSGRRRKRSQGQKLKK